ncbi:hypothetical protein AAF712_015054, partial [Marasmius tenuissimus]
MPRKEQEEAYDSVAYEPLLRGDSDSHVDGESAYNDLTNSSPLRRWRMRRRHKRLVIIVLGITNVIALLILVSLWFNCEPIPNAELQLLY